MASLARPLAPTAAAAPALVRRALAAGLAVALLDGLFATVTYTVVFPVTTFGRLWQGVARAVVGMRAFEGGGATTALGLAIHCGVALGWAAAFALLWHRWPALRRATATTGGALLVALAWGPLVWLAMNHVLLPFTHARPQEAWSRFWLIQLVGHAVVVGVPCVFVVRGGRDSATA